MKLAAASILAFNVLAGGGHEGHGGGHHAGHQMGMAMKEKSIKWSVIKHKALEYSEGFWLVEKYGVWENAQGTPDFYAVTEVHANPTTDRNFDKAKFLSWLYIG